jgi:transposase
VAAPDIGKAMLVACVRVPHDAKPGRRRQQVRSFATTTKSLLELADWLYCLGVTRVVMESTSTYWKPPFYVLEEQCECWLVNAREAKHVPGRPKTDTQDAVWLAKLAERGRLRPSFVPPPRQQGVAGPPPATGAPSSMSGPPRSSGWSRLLKDAQIKLSVVAADLFGVSGRQMLEALVTGSATRRSSRNWHRKDALQDQRLGRGAHRALPRPPRLPTANDARPHRYARRPGRPADQPDRPSCSPRLPTRWRSWGEIPGVGRIGAQALIAEIGIQMGRFPSARHLVAWANLAPTTKASAGKTTSSSTGNANPWIGATIGEAAMGPPGPRPFWAPATGGSCKRRGKKRALVAVGNQVLTIAYHLLLDPDARFVDLGADFHDRLHPQRRTRQLIRELEHVSGTTVTLHDAA